MESLADIIHSAFGAVLFCMAVGLLLVLSLSVMKENEAAAAEKKDVIYEGYAKNDEPLVTADGLYALLMSRELENPVEIDGTLYTLSNIGSTDISALKLKGEYLKAVIYGADGKVIKTVYRKK